MNNRISVGILVGLCLLILTGCSGDGSNPALPAAGSDPGLALTSGPDQAREGQQSRPHLIGYYDVLLDLENRGFELVPNRSVDFALNLMVFLNTPTGLSFNVNDVIPAPDFVDIDIDITLNHPLDDAMFDIYDVRAIFMGDGTEAMSYDSDLIYGGAGTHQGLLNADGYSRWFNPTGFDGGTLFDYVPNFLSTPDYTTSATLNPYKYYGEGLGAIDDLWTYLAAGDPQTGYFLHASSLTRNFLIRFPIPVPGLKYAFAIIANWEGTEPVNHPSHAYEAPGIQLVDNSSLYFVDENNNGGNLDLDITVFEWDAELTGDVMLDYDLYIESTVLYSDYKVNPGAMVPTVSGDHWNTFHVEIPADAVLSTVGNELWVIVEDNFADYTNPAGFPNEADDDPIAACFRFNLLVASEPPPPPDPWILVTDPNGGEIWPIGFNGEITWDSFGPIDNVKIELSMDSGTGYDFVLAATTPNDGIFEWNSIPVDFIGTQNRIKVSDVLDQLVFDESDADFTVTGDWLEVTSPNGGESWKVLSDHEITWDSSESTGEVYIEYSKDDFVSDINPIVNNTPNDGSYMWVDIPNDLSDTVKVRVYSIDPLMSDKSDGVFSIIGPDEYITVMSPNGGEEWEVKSDHEITWESSGVTGNVTIYCSSDNFVSDIYTIVEGAPNTLSYIWENISVASSNTMRMKVEWDDYPIINDISDADFSITDIGWGRAWGGPEDETDEGRAVAVDSDGNVFVTGIFWGTVDFDPDPYAGCTLISNGSEEAFLSKFDPFGNLVWARAWGSTGNDTGMDVAVDGFGNVYVTGYFEGTVDFDPDPFSEYTLTSYGDDDAYLLKLDSSGNFVWVVTWGGTSTEYGYGIAIDSTGDLYITGNFRDTVDFDPGPGNYPLISNGASDIYLLKLDSSSNFMWAGAWGGTSFDNGYGVAVDGAGNAYVTGNFQLTVDFDPDLVDEFPQTSNGVRDVFLNKLDSSGNFVWVRTWGGSSPEYGYGIAVDTPGNVYVTGAFATTVDFDPDPVDEFPLISNGSYDIFLSKFDSSGNFEWAGAWGGSDFDEGYEVAIDSVGNAYVVGHFHNIVDFDPDPVDEFSVTSNGWNDAFLSKFDPTGNFEWVRIVGEPLYERAKGVAVDGSGNIYTTGFFESNTIDLAPSESPCFEDPDLHNKVYYSDIFLVRYMPDGCW